MLDSSNRVLAETQAQVLANDAATVVLVEGLSDCVALDAAAAVLGVDLGAAGVDLMPMGGATNVGRFLGLLGPRGRDVQLAGLCDLGEEALFASQLEGAGLARGADRAALESVGFFVCTRDLEEELIRAVGAPQVEAIIERQGELASLRRLQQMPFHRGSSTEAHLHRFMGSRAGRKHRYAELLARELDASTVPRPLTGLLAYATGARARSVADRPAGRDGARASRRRRSAGWRR